MSYGQIEIEHNGQIDGTKIAVRSSLGESDSCVWCKGCGDFLWHGISCDCAARGYDPEEGREPMESMIPITGRIELRPFAGK